MRGKRCVLGLGLILSVGIFLSAAPVLGDTINVPGDEPTIQAGIDEAVDGDVVLVADGTYTGDGNKNIEFDGKAITVQSENGPEYCIIDCEDYGRGFYFHDGEEGDSVLSGITITHGDTSGGGGGIYCDDSSPTINNCIISGNVGTHGGGVYCNQSSPAIIGCTIVANVAGYFDGGGGVKCRHSSPTITGCTIIGNMAEREGGGILCNGTSSPIITDCIIRENTVGDYGGGIYGGSSSITLTNCVIAKNTANYGGGVTCVNGSALIMNCTFSGNIADRRGGGIYCYSDPSVQVTNCIFWGDAPGAIHDASDLGGAVVTYCDVQGGYPGEGNFHGAPLFVDAENGDYHLSVSSPCVYAATSDGAPEGDIEGTARPQGHAFDVGAYELYGHGATRPVVDSFTADLTEGDAPFEVTFTCTAHDPNGTIESYTIDYGDGSDPETNDTGFFTHTYDSAGIGAATCAVLDDQGTEVNSVSILVTRRGTVHVPSEYETIQSAIDAVPDDSTVLIADGTYIGEENKNINFHGKAIIVESENGPENCMIDCEGDGRGFIFQNDEEANSVVSGITITNGNADTGGGIYCEKSSPTILNCIVTGNTGSRAAGVYCNSSSPIMTDCKIIANVADDAGGGVYCSSPSSPLSSPEITNCIFSENAAPLGGAICFHSSTPIIINCVIDRNTADTGGGIYYDTGTPIVAYCTFNRNVANETGGAISGGAQGTIRNCIFWGDLPNEITLPEWHPHIETTYCDVQGGFDGEGNFHGDPLFVDAENGDYHLSVRSPCVYAATSDGAPDTDIEGTARPQGHAYDVGAYELYGYDATRPIIDSFTSDSTEGDTPFEVAFTCTAHDPDGEIISYTMDYGDGSPPETNDTGVFTHIYDSMGIGDATCTVLDDEGVQVDSFSIIIVRRGAVRVPSDYPTIQSAIDALIDLPFDGNTVLVADGTYSGEGNKNLDFKGKALVVQSENGPENCIIDCEGDGRGFVFENDEGEDSVVSGITITNGDEYSGGGIYCNESSPTISNCVIRENTATNGGGICCESAPIWTRQPTITGCVIRENTATNGGGVYCDETSPTIKECTIVGNVAEDSGGGIWVDADDASMIITNCILSENVADSGGAIRTDSWSSPVIVTNCVFSGNRGAFGGGIHYYGFLGVTNCTFNKNIGNETGGAIYCRGSSSGNIRNCILWEDVPNEIDANGTATATFCDVQGGFEGEGNFHGDPLFVDAENGDYHLSVSSPCVYAATSDGAPDTDIEGTARPQGHAFDVGAYELSGHDATRPIVDSFTADSTEGDIPFEVSFTCTAHDPNGTIVSYIIDYGDGSEPETNDTGVFTHTYDSVSTVYATCTVVDNEGITVNSVTIIIKVTGPIYVPADYSTIQEAIDAQFEGGVVLVADGIYTGVGNKNLSFDGKAITVMSENGPWDCVIDCKGKGRGFIFDSGEGEDSVVAGFTIVNGNGEGEGYPSRGGGIYCASFSSPTISYCLVLENTADGDGGGIYCKNSSPTITNCAVSWNVSYGRGGGIACDGSSPTITGCVIGGNAALNGGGGIHCYGSSATVTNCIISYNYAEYNGGAGIYCWGCSPRITNCTITRSLTAQNSIYGSGIACHNSSPIVRNCILWEDSPYEIDEGEDVTYSNVQGGYEGEGNTGESPMFFDPDNGVFYISHNSPCIDAGNNSAVPAGVTEDIDGEPRIMDGDKDGTATVDMGAVEYYDTDDDLVPDVYEKLSCMDYLDCDTDEDGILDGDEDLNRDGWIDAYETDPCNIDTDGDGIQDGTESGVTLDDIDPSCTDTAVFQPDLDPTTTTRPLCKDSDWDRLHDGEEDLNHNGRVDEGETDPNDNPTAGALQAVYSVLLL